MICYRYNKISSFLLTHRRRRKKKKKKKRALLCSLSLSLLSALCSVLFCSVLFCCVWVCVLFWFGSAQCWLIRYVS